MERGALKSKIFYFSIFAIIFLFSELGYPQQSEIAEYPNRPITYIGMSPAGNIDELALRLIAKEAERFLRQPIIVLDKPGAGGTLATAAIASAKPDGYTIGNVGATPMFFTPRFENVPYHPLRDLTSIIQFGAFNMGIIVRADSPFKGFNDLIDYARQNPKKLTYGTHGTNSQQNITVELICNKEKVEMTHIPFKGTAESQTALLGGHIVFAVGAFNYPLIEAGKIKPIVLLRQQKSTEYPETPILKDFGYNIPEPGYISVTGPKGIPKEIVEKIEKAFAEAMKQPAFIKGMKELRLPIVYRNSKELSDLVAYNYEYWGKVIKERGPSK